MATRYKVLGQVATAATTDTTLYTVPSGKDAVVSTIVVANRNNVPDTYRIAVRPGGETLATKHYIAFDVTVASSDSTTITIGLTLSPTDIITVRAGAANLSFSVYGSEIDI
jgi:hypothetical protein